MGRTHPVEQSPEFILEPSRDYDTRSHRQGETVASSLDLELCQESGIKRLPLDVCKGG